MECRSMEGKPKRQYRAKLTLRGINIEQVDCYVSEVLSQKLVVWKRMSRDIYYYYYYYYHPQHHISVQTAPLDVRLFPHSVFFVTFTPLQVCER